MGFIGDNWPYTNEDKINLDWVLKQVQGLQSNLSDFVSLNTVKYANPFEWNITSQYAANTVVSDPETNTVYLSVAAVPSGTGIDNTDYWVPVFTLPDIPNEVKNAITPVSVENGTAYSETLYPYNLVWIDNELYTPTAEIAAGTPISAGVNTVKTSVSGELLKLANSIETETTARESAISNLGEQIQTETAARESAISNLEVQIQKTASVSAWIYPRKPPEDSGLIPCAGDGKTDDSSNMQAIINYAAENHYGIFLDRVYSIANTIILPSSSTIIGLSSSRVNRDYTDPTNISAVSCGFLYTGSSNAISCVHSKSVYIANISILGTTSSGNVTDSPVPANLLYLDCCVGGYFSNISLAYSATAISIGADSATYANDNSMWNTFVSIAIVRCSSGLILDGISGTNLSNSCHNTFIQLYLQTTGRGIVLKACDNNAFYDIFWYGLGSSYAVQLDSGASGNYFYHAQGRFLMWGNDGLNVVFGYDTSNSQSAPFSGNNSTGRLYYFTDRGIFGKCVNDGNFLITTDENLDYLSTFLLNNSPLSGSVILKTPTSSSSVWGEMYYNNARYSMGSLS